MVCKISTTYPAKKGLLQLYQCKNKKNRIFIILKTIKQWLFPEEINQWT